MATVAGASAAVLGLTTAVGFVTTRIYDLKLRIPADFTPSRTDFPIVGIQALVPELFYAFVAILAYVILGQTWRLATYGLRRTRAVGDTLESLRRSVEIPVRGSFEVSAGVDLLRFGGDGHDAVVKLSVPVYGQLRIPLGLRGNWFLRMALGGRYFPSFDTDDFGGAVRGLKTESGEVSLAAMLGIDHVRR